MVVVVIGLISPGRSRAMWRTLYGVGRGLDDWIDLFPNPDVVAAGGSSKQTMDSALNQTEDLVRALRRGGVADPHVQAQLSAVLQSIDNLATSAGAETAPKTTGEPSSETSA